MMEDAEETTPLRVALFEAVNKRLNADSFELKTAQDKFIRRHFGITDHFQLACKDARPGYRVQPNVGVRIDRVEEIFHRTSGFEPQYQDNTSTMGTSVGSLLAGSPRAFEILLESDFEIDRAAEKILGVFREFALPYFERWSSLAAIDSELNHRPGERTIHRALAWFRCSTGIIVARLVGRPNYDELAAFYVGVMTRDNKGFYLKRFRQLLMSLDSVEAESGSAQF